MPRMLKDLKILDVSSVDRGAGHGVRVLMSKRDNDETIQKLKLGIYEHARKRFAEQETPVPTAEDVLRKRVDESRNIQKLYSEAIKENQRQHPGRSRADALQAVLDGPTVKKIMDAERRIDDEVAKLGGGTLPQPGATAHIDFGGPPLGRTGYDSSVDGRRSGTARASGGPQSGTEPQPAIEDANTVLERLTKEHMKSGKTHARAVMAASATKEFGDAHRAERARKFGI
jgi:hypothetical protein